MGCELRSSIRDRYSTKGPSTTNRNKERKLILKITKRKLDKTV